MKYLRPLIPLALLLWSISPAPAVALVILQYHHISDSTPAATSTSPSRFERHLELIEAAGFQVLGLPQVLALVHSSEPLPDKSVLITFDDAYETIFTVAHPLLRARNWPYAVFVSTDAIDVGARHMMSWAQLQQLSKEGAAMANHSRSHGHLVRYPAGADEQAWLADVMQDIAQAEARITEQTGHRFRAFAYPYGEFNLALQQRLEHAGYVAFGQQSGPAAVRDRMALARFPMGGDYGDDADFSLKLHTLPLPFAERRLVSGNGKALMDGVLRQADRPIVSYASAVAPQIQCFASGQGLAQRVEAGQGWASFQATRPLPPGRSRYNCTAPAGNGRYFWHSNGFLRPNDDGSWPFEP